MAKITVEKQIVKHLKDNGQKLSWLAGKIGLSAPHLYQTLKGSPKLKRKLTDENLAQINEALRTEFNR